MKLIPPVPGPPLGLPDPLRRIQLPADLDPHAFGHLGFTNILAWADGEQATSVAVINRGKPDRLRGVLPIPRHHAAHHHHDAESA